MFYGKNINIWLWSTESDLIEVLYEIWSIALFKNPKK